MFRDYRNARNCICRYNVFFLVLTYVVPVVTMGVTYSCMSTVLWGSRCIGESTERQQNALKAKQKVLSLPVSFCFPASLSNLQV